MMDGTERIVAEGGSTVGLESIVLVREYVLALSDRRHWLPYSGSLHLPISFCGSVEGCWRRKYPYCGYERVCSRCL
jgi:hypothetical protein